MTLCHWGRAFSLEPSTLHPWRSCQGFPSLCPSLLNQPKSKTQPVLPGLGGPPQMVWAQLSFPQAQRQLGPNCL